MTPDELRALAEALEPMSAAPRFDCLPVVEFCAWLRQCAEEKPVAWRYEVRGTAPTTEWKQYGVYVTERAARNHASLAGSGIEGRVVPLFTHPAPTLSAH